MAIEIKHKFVSAKGDGADSTLVQPSNWNDTHNFTMAAGKILGTRVGDTTVRELPLAVDATEQSIVLPSGATGSRPASPSAGMIRYNTTTNAYEFHNGTTWATMLTATTLADGSVTNAKLANMAANTFKGRTTPDGPPEDINMTIATSMLNVFNAAAKGLVPASGGGTSTFLRADGSWAAPPTGGGGGGGTVTSITAGAGLTGGTITTSGTIALDISYSSNTFPIGTILFCRSGGASFADGATFAGNNIQMAIANSSGALGVNGTTLPSGQTWRNVSGVLLGANEYGHFQRIA